MLSDPSASRGLMSEAWQWRNELNPETAARDAAQNMEEYLGFSGDRENNTAVSMRVKTLYQESAIRHLSIRPLRSL